jgi:hypothetical protein
LQLTDNSLAVRLSRYAVYVEFKRTIGYVEFEEYEIRLFRIGNLVFVAAVFIVLDSQ